MEKNRSSFKGSIGFVLAAAGSAVGLGNIWRFPYLAAKDNGGFFILCYIILALTFGFTLLVTEIALGRKTKQSPLTAYSKINKNFRWLGTLATLVPIIILPYYCAIGGWVLKYFVTFVTGDGVAAATDDYFTGHITSLWQPIILMIVFLAVTALIIFGGVNKGIEKTSRVLMPILFLLIIGIAIFALTLKFTDADGVTRTGLQGLKIYLVPDFKALTLKSAVTTIFDALGQLFFSISVAMGIMVAYGSYVDDKTNLMKSVNQIEIFDTLVALLAGLMIVPAVFVFMGKDGMSAGPGLMFIFLPNVFANMPGGKIVMVIFFLAVAFAGLTSLVNLFETPVEALQTKFGFSRKKAVCIIALVGSVIAICIEGIVSGWMDVCSIYICPLGALIAGIMFFWVCGKDFVREQIDMGAKKKIGGWFEFASKYVFCGLTIVVLVLGSLLGGIG